jgi:NTP pyrophosphatase (non-canonical NTP hydrolase)
MAEYEFPLPIVDVNKYVDGELVESYRHPKDSKASGSTGTNQGGASAYTFDNYQEDTGTTAIYPEAGTSESDAIQYCIFGLIGEAGEIANKYKKILRDHDGDINLERLTSIANEIGDVLWYCSQLSSELGVQLSTIAAENIRKLNDRKQRDKLHGSGDDR